VIRRLDSSDVAAFREIRLEALRVCPEAFSSSFEEEQHRTTADFAGRVAPEPPDAVFGAFLDDDAALVGIAGFRVYKNVKERHKSMLWGMYVRPVARGRGVGTALVRRVIEHARNTPGVEILQLGVTADNAAACALYDRADFRPYGVERQALRLAPGDYRDEELRSLDLAKASITSV
jgi:RimJ/RimL family protein N-acetyltransferase